MKILCSILVVLMVSCTTATASTRDVKLVTFEELYSRAVADTQRLMNLPNSGKSHLWYVKTRSCLAHLCQARNNADGTLQQENLYIRALAEAHRNIVNALRSAPSCGNIDQLQLRATLPVARKRS